MKQGLDIYVGGCNYITSIVLYFKVFEDFVLLLTTIMWISHCGSTSTIEIRATVGFELIWRCHNIPIPGLRPSTDDCRAPKAILALHRLVREFIIAIRNTPGHDLIGSRLQIILAHITIPAVGNKVSTELLIAHPQVFARQIRHKEESNQDSNDATNSSDDESPLVPQTILDRLKRLRTDSSTRLPNSRREPVTSPSNTSSIRLRRDQTEHIAWTEIARALHQSIEDDEERHDFSNAVVGATDNQAKDQVSAEADHHDGLAAKTVAENGSEENTRQRDCTEEKLPFACFQDCAVVHDRGDNCTGEDTVGESDEV